MNSKTAFLVLAAGAASCAAHALAQEATPEQTLPPLVITGTPLGDEAPGGVPVDKGRLAAQRAGTSDTARLLENIPGVASYGAGGISSLPVVHGLADDRLRTTVNGMDLMSGCPNHMNPALSFIDPTRVLSVDVFAGISPVSVGGDSIGGTIQVKSAPPKFPKEEGGFLAEGQAGTFSRSNGNARGDHFGVTLAGSQASLSYTESNSESDNYWAASDFKMAGAWKSIGQRILSEHEVGNSEYNGSRNRDLGLAFRLSRNHQISLNLSEQRLDYEGFPNQRMDMVASTPVPGSPGAWAINKNLPSNINKVANLRYSGTYDWGELEASFFTQDLQHHMDMLQDRKLGTLMPMDTKASTTGGALKASIDLSDTDLVRIGGDFQKYRLDDWWPPLGVLPGLMCCNDFWNIRDGRRDRAYIFTEWEARPNPAWLTLIGLRSGTVTSDAAAAQGYSNAYAVDAARFNARDHLRKDRHLDLTALARYTPDATQTYEAGVARKTRSPSLYERYPWSFNTMAAAMNNFVGDGNAYIGNLDLKPEIAITLRLGGDWHAAEKEQGQLKITGYLTYVQDYIDAQRCSPTMSATCVLSNVTTTNSYVRLQYVNQSARLYGFDVSGHKLLGRADGIGSFTGTAMLAYVRGENRSTGDSLYHMMPLNAKLALIHRLEGWTNTAEVQLVGDKKQVSHVRNEVPTPDYTLLNLRSSYEWKHGRIDLALENALNTFYLMPLGGAYMGQGNSMSMNTIPWGMTVPGRARSLNVALNVNF